MKPEKLVTWVLPVSPQLFSVFTDINYQPTRFHLLG